MSFAARLHAAHAEEVPVEVGGVTFYLRRFDSLDIARHGGSGILAAIPGEDWPPPRRVAGAMDAEAPITPFRLVCSAVVGAKEAGGERTPLRFVMREECEDLEHDLAYVGRLPQAAIRALVEAVTRMLAEDGADLGRFLGGGVGDGAPAGDGLRDGSSDGAGGGPGAGGGVDAAAGAGGDAGSPSA